MQYIDLDALGAICDQPDKYIYCLVLPGSFCLPSTVLAKTVGLSAREQQLVANAFALDIQRSYEQDPRFGLCALSEVASRALSPAVNDPSTAIDVISRGTRLLAKYATERQAMLDLPVRKNCTQVYCGQATVEDFFDDFFTPIARDGAALIEVAITLQKSLRHLAENSPALYQTVAYTHAKMAVIRANALLLVDEDKQLLQRQLDRFEQLAAKTKRSD